LAYVNYPGGSSALPGCQEVSLECSGDEIEHSACDDLAIRYRGLTGLACTADATIVGGFTLVRDVDAVKLGGTPISNVTSITMTLTANELSDSSDADSWLTYVGVTGRSVEAVITTRCVDVLKGSSKFRPGCIGDLTVNGKGGAVSGCPGGGTNEGATDIAFGATKLMVTGVQVTGTHGDFAEAIITAKGTDSVDSFSGTSGIPMASKPGKSDVFSFKVLDATDIDETTTTTGVTFTLKNAVLMENTVTLTHGEMMENSFSVKAFSTDGQTSPMTVS
jgi:hypothetical protein